MMPSSSSLSASPLMLWLHGQTGRMGQELVKLLEKSEQPDFVLVGGSGLHTADASLRAGLKASSLILDFTGREGNQRLQQLFKSERIFHKKVLIGSTGLESSLLKGWELLAHEQQLSVLWAPNTSLGVLLTLKAALGISKVAVDNAFDVELIEAHHRGKKDAPSGTALFLAENIAKAAHLKPSYHRSQARREGELGVHAVRGGGVFGEHNIRFLGNDEEIIISHRAYSRTLFANGALILSRWLSQKPFGFYSLLDV